MSPPPPPIRVLLVEDNPGDAHLVRALLGPSVSVTVAGTLAEALALLASHPFDVALVDLFLPDARDLHSVREVRAHAPELPVVVLTGSDGGEWGTEAVRIGAQDYLDKARIDPEVLTRTVRYAIERNRREQVERALKRGEEYFQALIENSSDIISVIDADGTTRYVSAAIESLLGYPQAERVGEPLIGIIHPDDRAHLMATIAAAREQPGRVVASDFRALHRDGTLRTLHASGVNQLDNPAVRGIIINAHDITARTAAEAGRERTVSLLRATLEATLDGILVVDRDGGVVTWNEQFLRMWRIARTPLATDRDSDLLQPVLNQLRDPAGFLGRVEELYGDPEAESFDLLEFRDGRIFERYTRAQRLDGEAVGRVWSFRDVSERVRLQAELQQAQRMEAVGRLAGGIAHDFNNLLTTIKGTTALLLMDAAAGGAIRADLEEIERAADHAAGLTSQLLAFGRKQVLRPERLELNQVVERLRESLQQSAGDRVQVRLQLDAGVGSVRFDRGQLGQVIHDLVMNAAGAMAEGGVLTLSTGVVAPDQPDAPPRVRLSVHDTGPGMDEETRAHIFDPFFTTREPGSGSGLALSAVYGIVRQSGGDVQVESEPGQGSVFTVILPATAAEAAQPAPSGAPEQVAGATILLVEDEAPVRRIVRRILAREGFTVLEASGPDAARRIVAEHPGPIQLLLSDVLMPGMNGPELAELLLRGRPEMKVIFMSGYTRGELGLPEAGRAGMLQKPFEPGELVLLVRRALAG